MKCGGVRVRDKWIAAEIENRSVFASQTAGWTRSAGTKGARQVRSTKEYITLYFENTTRVAWPRQVHADFRSEANRHRCRLSSRLSASRSLSSLSGFRLRDDSPPRSTKKRIRVCYRTRLVANDPSPPPASCRAGDRREYVYHRASIPSPPPLPLSSPTSSIASPSLSYLSPPGPWNLEQEPRGEAARYQLYRRTRYQRRSLQGFESRSILSRFLVIKKRLESCREIIFQDYWDRRHWDQRQVRRRLFGSRRIELTE